MMFFLVKWKGEEYLVNGFFYADDEDYHIIIACHLNVIKLTVVFFHEFLHYVVYMAFSNVDVRENIDDKINKFCRYLPDLIE